MALGEAPATSHTVANVVGPSLKITFPPGVVELPVTVAVKVNALP